MAYAELHCISNYSFLRGASHPEELVMQAAKLGYRAIAITDECTMAGIVKAHVAAKEHGIKLIIGSEFQLDDDLLLVLAHRIVVRVGPRFTSTLINTRGPPRTELGVALATITMWSSSPGVV